MQTENSREPDENAEQMLLKMKWHRKIFRNLASDAQVHRVDKRMGCFVCIVFMLDCEWLGALEGALCVIFVWEIVPSKITIFRRSNCEWARYRWSRTTFYARANFIFGGRATRIRVPLWWRQSDFHTHIACGRHIQRKLGQNPLPQEDKFMLFTHSSMPKRAHVCVCVCFGWIYPDCREMKKFSEAFSHVENI